MINPTKKRQGRERNATAMELNAELTTVLRDIVQFLECLRDVKLPISLESDRDSLLTRSKDALTTLAMENVGRLTAPEPYLNMNAARSKGLMATLKEEAELQEYVRAEEHQQIQKQQQQDYYETFQAVESSSNVVVAAPVLSEAVAVPDTFDNLRDKDEQIENALIDIYSCFSAAQTKNKCQISGSLYRKEGKKLFVFEQYRACWVGLVGFHLLIYGNDRDHRPCTILPIRGYMARPAPNAIARDQRRSESTFEIVRPGSRTFQFIAKTPKDMEEWVRKICNLGGGVAKEHRDVTKVAANVIGRNENAKPINDGEYTDRKEERYQDVGSAGVDKQLSDEHSVVSIAINGDTGRGAATEAENSFSNDALLQENLDAFPQHASPPSSVSADAAASPSRRPPVLPLLQTHTPRRLPSLPARHSSYEFPDDEEDDIYHKIEDFRDTIQYGNILGASQVKSDNSRSTKEFITYDDVRSTVKPETKINDKRNVKDVQAVTARSAGSRSEETYDDTANAVVLDTKGIDRQDSVSYDDVENFLLNSKSINVRETSKSDESAKSPQKRSFLDRVRSKRESPRKVEKKTKLKSSPRASVPPTSSPGSPTYYDDVCDLISIQQETNRFEEEQSEYTCPPPPRPIYVKPPTIGDVTDANEFYDDVTAYRYRFTNSGETTKLDQQTTNKPDQLHDTTRLDVDRPVLCENVDYSQQCTMQDNEHYKTPRVESRYHKCINIDQGVEDLYDDIAILADFTARQKEILTRRESGSAMRSHANSEKKPWNRFVSGRKLKITDATAVGETNIRISNGIEDSADNFSEQHGSIRMNTFQKLISRMENSLGKGPAKSTSSIMLNKTNAPNNV